jgi:uncharacterized protein (TIGR02246 family)
MKRKNMTSDKTHNELDVVFEELVNKFDAAWNGRDPDALGVLLTEDADFQFYYGLLVRGRERIKRYYREKVFPYLPEGLKHITRSYKVRQLTDKVVIADGRVDLVDEDEEDPEKRLQHRLKVTTVVVKEEKGWRYSAVRIMVPMKE